MTKTKGIDLDMDIKKDLRRLNVILVKCKKISMGCEYIRRKQLWKSTH